MKPSEVIVLDLVEKIQQLFPNLDLRELPSSEPFAYLEPANFFHDYLEQEASKGIQALWTVIAKPRMYNLFNKAWTEHGPQTLPPGSNWLKWCWMGAMDINGPIACFKSPIYAPSASLPCISQRERSVDMCFTRGAFCNTWTFSNLQSIVDRPINTMLSPRKWENGYWKGA
ncbi:hypothetical protein TNCV_3792591 [Trichonephila clavipes]|nr:hypothetical protein TNCV_3792591 [Trichonephila clavipes]